MYVKESSVYHNAEELEISREFDNYNGFSFTAKTPILEEEDLSLK